MSYATYQARGEVPGETLQFVMTQQKDRDMTQFTIVRLVKVILHFTLIYALKDIMN